MSDLRTVCPRYARAFSVLEVVIVLSIVGVAGAIVTPRLSRAGESLPTLSQDVLVGDLRALREAVRAYAADHDGHNPTGDGEQVSRQLTGFTDRQGRPSPHHTATHRFGPYIREIPPLPVGANAGRREVVVTGTPGRGGWVYDVNMGWFWANTLPGECDDEGRTFRGY